MESSVPDRETGPDSRRRLPVWALWVLVSGLGGAVGGSTFELEFIGPIFLFGPILGAAQVLVLWRYLKEAVFLWVLLSSFGWFAGWIAFGLSRTIASQTGISEVFRPIGSAMSLLVGTETAREQSLLIVVWAVFAAFQGAALALEAWEAGRQPSLPLAALWLAAGVAGGALAVAASLTISARVFHGSGASVPLGPVASQAAEQAVAGAIYGATTGVVLAMIARRSVVQEDSTR